MAIIEGLSKEDLKNVTGGTIVEAPTSSGSYYVVVNEKLDGSFVTAQRTIGAAQYIAQQYGLSQEVITPEQYEKKSKQPFRGY